MSDRDLPRDAHLQAALRHAPDRDLAPPAELSTRILAQARAQPGRGARPASAAGAFERWFGSLSRPMAAGALGSLLVAGLVGLLWREGPPADNLAGADRTESVARPEPAAPPSPPAPPPAAAEPSAAPTSKLAKAPAAPAPDPAPGRDAGERPEPLKREQRAPIADNARQAQVQAVPSAAPPPPAAPPAAPPPPPAAAPVAAPALRTAPAPAPAAAPPPAPSRMTHTSREAAAPAAGSAAAFDPLVPPLLALRSDADRALRERLQSLQRRLAGPWVDATPPAGVWGEALQAADGSALGRLREEPTSVMWQGLDGLTWRAPLRPDVTAR